MFSNVVRGSAGPPAVPWYTGCRRPSALGVARCSRCHHPATRCRWARRLAAPTGIAATARWARRSDAPSGFASTARYCARSSNSALPSHRIIRPAIPTIAAPTPIPTGAMWSARGAERSPTHAGEPSGPVPAVERARLRPWGASKLSLYVHRRLRRAPCEPVPPLIVRSPNPSVFFSM